MLTNACSMWIDWFSWFFRKDVSFHFGPKQKASFESLKGSMVEVGTLAYFDKSASTKAVADASPVGLRAVLMQKHDGAWVSICYASRNLTEWEQKFSQTEKEALALVGHARGTTHTFMVTNHKPFEVTYGPRSKPSARIERWVIRLQPYDFWVVYAPGQSMWLIPSHACLARTT